MSNDASGENSTRSYRKATLRGDSFAGQDLSGADFAKARLTEVDFTGADLSGADFSGARLVDCRIRDAKAEKTVFKGAVFEGGEVEGLAAGGADFSRAAFKGTRVARLSGADIQARELAFQKCAVESLRLTGADLRESSWIRSTLTGAQWSGCRLDSLKGPSWSVSDCVFENCRFHYADLLSATFSASTFNGGDLVECDLAGSHWKGSSLKGCNLTKSDFTTADTDSDLFADCVMKKTNLRYMTGIEPERLVELRAAGAKVSRYLLHRAFAWLVGTNPGRAVLLVTLGVIGGGTYRVLTDPRFFTTNDIYQRLQTAEERRDDSEIKRLNEALVDKLKTENPNDPEVGAYMARALYRLGRVDEALAKLDELGKNPAEDPNRILDVLTYMAQTDGDAGRFDRIETYLDRVLASEGDPEMRRQAAATVLYAAMPSKQRELTARLFEKLKTAFAQDPEAMARFTMIQMMKRLDDPNAEIPAEQIDHLLSLEDKLAIHDRIELVRLLIKDKRGDEALRVADNLLARKDLQPTERVEALSQRALALGRGDDDAAFYAAVKDVMTETADRGVMLGAIQENVGALAEAHRYERLNHVVDLARDTLTEPQSIKDLRILRVNTLMSTPLRDVALADLKDLTSHPEALLDVERVLLAAVCIQVPDEKLTGDLLRGVRDPETLPEDQRYDYQGLSVRMDVVAGRVGNVPAGVARLLKLPGGAEPKLNNIREIMGELAHHGEFAMLDKVAEQALSSLGRNPRADYEIKYARAQAFMYGEHPEKAVADYEYLLSLPPANPGKRLTLLQGILPAYRNAGRMKDVERTVATIAKEFPEETEFLFNSHLEEAQALRGRGDKEGAEALLKSLLEQANSNEDKARVANNLASLYIDLQRFHDAQAMIDQALSVTAPLSQPWVEAQAHEANLYLQEKRYQDSITQIDKLLAERIDPAFEEWLRTTRMNALSELGRYDEAAAEGEKLVSVTTDPTSRAYHQLDITRVYIKSGHVDKAIAIWDEVTKPIYPTDLRQGSYEHIIQYYFEKGDRNEALAAAERMEKDAGDNETLRVGGMARQAYLFGQWGETDRLLKQLERVADAEMPALVPNAVMSLTSIDSADARLRALLIRVFENVEKASVNGPDPQTYWNARVNRAQLLLLGQKVAAATPLLEEAMDKAPDPNIQVQAATMLAQQSLQDHHVDHAREIYLSLPKRWPGRQDAPVQSLIGLAEIEKQAGNHDKALEYLQNASQICPDEGTCCQIMGDIVYQQREKKNADGVKAAYQRVVDNYPGCWIMQEAKEVLSGAQPPF